MRLIRKCPARRRSPIGFEPIRILTIAEKDGRVVGTYILKPNRLGPGSHVANAAFMVASDAQGSGVGRRMAEHCLTQARRMGFRAMQFNFVISTNTPATHLWEQVGFKIVGTLPGAFHHPEKGYVDVYVMYPRCLKISCGRAVR
jgi:ribosomal protein S18 acetylase RimI-like enzyme